MLGHRSMDMNLRYTKITNRTFADEYFAATDKVEALHGQPWRCPPTRPMSTVPEAEETSGLVPFPARPAPSPAA